MIYDLGILIIIENVDLFKFLASSHTFRRCKSFIDANTEMESFFPIECQLFLGIKYE